MPTVARLLKTIHSFIVCDSSRLLALERIGCSSDPLQQQVPTLLSHTQKGGLTCSNPGPRTLWFPIRVDTFHSGLRDFAGFHLAATPLKLHSAIASKGNHLHRLWKRRDPMDLIKEPGLSLTVRMVGICDDYYNGKDKAFRRTTHGHTNGIQYNRQRRLNRWLLSLKIQ